MARLLKTVLFTIVISMIYVNIATARPSTRSFTCDELVRFIQARGAVVMNTKNAYVYRRFVAHSGYCYAGETAVYHTVPTKTGKCRLKICEDRDLDEWRWRLRVR